MVKLAVALTGLWIAAWVVFTYVIARLDTHEDGQGE
jgi:hypothetical protein